MKALILNSGLGKRMGDLTNEHPKCMTELSIGKTIVSRQLSQLADVGITDIVMTTGPFADVLESYIASLRLPINISYVECRIGRHARAGRFCHDGIVFRAAAREGFQGSSC